MIGIAMKHEDSTIYLDVPAPANGRRYVPRSPTGVHISLIATPELDDVTLLFVLRVPVVMLLA